MLTQPIALVPEAADAWQSRSHSTVPTWSAELLRVGAALQNQVSQDLGPQWGVQATVNVFAALEEVPVGYWPIIVRDGELGADAGVHLDEHGQPYARVARGPLWSMAASRACLEMLVNPYGDRCVSAPSPRSGLERASEPPSGWRGSVREQSTVQVLVEVCGPCADPALGYAIHGVMVSDFCLPSFFAASARDARDRLSFRHGLGSPFEPHAGGHLTWFDPISNLWWVRRHTIDGAVDTKLGPVDRKLTSARRLVQQHLVASAEASFLTDTQVQEDAHAAQEYAEGAARARALRLRAQLGSPSEITQAVLHEGTSELDADDLEEIEARAEEQEFAQDPELARELEPEALDEELQEPFEEEEGPDASVSEDEVAEAVELVSYDSASDVLTESIPPALPGARVEPEPRSASPEPKTITPVPPVPSIAPPPALAKPRSAGQLSMLSDERKDTPRRGVIGVGLGLAGAAAAVWFLSASPNNRPQEARPVKSEQETAATSSAGASKPSNPSVESKALPPTAAAPTESAPATTVAPATTTTPATATPAAPTQTPIAAATAPSAPASKTVEPQPVPDTEAQLAAAERRRARRERLATEQARAPSAVAASPIAPTVPAAAPQAAARAVQAPVPVAPSTTATAPVVAARPAPTASAGDALEDLIESRH